MDREAKDTEATVPESAAQSPGRTSRRAFLRAGSAATPVLMTLASGPVSASTACQVASSFVSVSVYHSRNPGVVNVNCVGSNTAATLAANAPSSNYSGIYNDTVVSYFYGNPAGISTTLKLGDLYYNSGNRLVSTGDTAVLQRLVALSYQGSNISFSNGIATKTYVTTVWNAYHGGTLNTLVGSGNGTWDTTRLIKWLDYVAGGAPFP